MKNKDKKVEINNIYNLDCLELFKRMKEAEIQVDSIVADPPYNISRKNNFKTIGREINFGEWDWDFDQIEWIKQSYDLLKPGGSIIVFNDWKNLGAIAHAMEELGYEIKDIIRWIKPNPMPRNTTRRYVTDYEFAIWAVKTGGKWTFNKCIGKAYLTPEYKYAPEMSKTKRIHPTQKSLKLIKDILITHSNEGDIILDPFMGSGTLALAARQLGRSFIGCEISKVYWKKSILRLEENE